MPVATARLPNVSPGDAQPLVFGGRRQHFLQQLAVALLQLVALAQRDTSLGDPSRQGVAHPLQLTEVSNSRRSCRAGRASVNSKPREGLGREAGQLPLEAPDLAPQLGTSKSLVTVDSKLISLQHTHVDQFRPLISSR